MQTLGWFTATIIGVALFSGTFLRWHIVDKLVGIAVLLGVGWLLARPAGSAAADVGNTIAKSAVIPILFKKNRSAYPESMTQEEIAHLKERLSKSQEQANQLLETLSAVQTQNHVLKEQLAEVYKRIEEVEKRKALAGDFVKANVVKSQSGQKKACNQKKACKKKRAAKHR